MDFVLDLEYSDYVPLFRRLSDALRKAIQDGRLKPGDAMPSVRDISSTLNVSRATVLKAFSDLGRQGYVETFKGAGTCVSRQLPGDLGDLINTVSETVADSTVQTKVELSRYAQRLQQNQPEQIGFVAGLSEINYGGPPLELTPLAQWQNKLRQYCQFRELENVAYAVEPFGYQPLREAVAAYLSRFRAVRCEFEQVAIFATKQLRLDTIARLLLDQGDLVAFEDPGFSEARSTFASFGAEVVPIPVDADGIDVDYLESLPQQFKLVYVTPSHQDPTGAVLSMERRRRLLAWAKKTGAFIVEDDYDSEFRYGSQPLPSLQGMDDGDCVIYLGSLWKVLFQVMRFGYVVVPRCLQKTLLLAKMQCERYLPVVEQMALTDFMNEGVLERYIRKMQSTYARKRQQVIYALTRSFGGKATIAAESGGMHLMLRLPTTIPESKVLDYATQAQLAVVSTAPFYMRSPAPGEFMVGFADIDGELINQQVGTWAKLIDEAQK